LSEALAVLDHYKAVLGSRFRSKELQSEWGSLVVLRWEPQDNSQGVHLYATLEASDEELPLDPRHRAEVFIGLLPDADGDQVAQLLANVAFAHRSEGIAWRGARTYAFDRDLWPGSPMRTAWIRSGEAIIPSLWLPEGRHVEFLQVVPLHEAELASLKTMDAQSFIGRLADLHVPIWDTFRPPAPLE
jgi:hypothetical protein